MKTMTTQNNNGNWTSWATHMYAEVRQLYENLWKLEREIDDLRNYVHNKIGSMQENCFEKSLNINREMVEVKTRLGIFVLIASFFSGLVTQVAIYLIKELLKK